jgi:hypothetical protein
MGDNIKIILKMWVSVYAGFNLLKIGLLAGSYTYIILYIYCQLQLGLCPVAMLQKQLTIGKQKERITSFWAPQGSRSSE